MTNASFINSNPTVKVNELATETADAAEKRRESAQLNRELINQLNFASGSKRGAMMWMWRS